MARVSITLTDTEEEGGVSFRVEFDPPLSKDQEEATHAQAEAAFLIEIMQRRASGQTLAEMASEVDDSEYGEVLAGTMTESTEFDEDEEDLS